jgi:hypothetical protein
VVYAAQGHKYYLTDKLRGTFGFHVLACNNIDIEYLVFKKSNPTFQSGVEERDPLGSWTVTVAEPSILLFITDLS